MRYNRRSIRLKGYDYSQEGAYFVTICTQNQVCLFGDVIGDEVCLNEAGQMIEHWFMELERKFPDIRCGDIVCMPNHIHFIVINTGNDSGTDDNSGEHIEGEHVGSPLRTGNGSGRGRPVCLPEKACLPKMADENHSDSDDHSDDHSDEHIEGEHVGSPLRHVVQWFKTMTTNAYIRGVKTQNWLGFQKRLWQRNYYEHIIRNQADFDRVQSYIQNNPAKWTEEKENNA
jgi:putative transposase